MKKNQLLEKVVLLSKEKIQREVKHVKDNQKLVLDGLTKQLDDLKAHYKTTKQTLKKRLESKVDLNIKNLYLKEVESFKLRTIDEAIQVKLEEFFKDKSKAKDYYSSKIKEALEGIDFSQSKVRFYVDTDTELVKGILNDMGLQTKSDIITKKGLGKGMQCEVGGIFYDLTKNEIIKDVLPIVRMKVLSSLKSQK